MPKRFSRADLHKFLKQDPDTDEVLRNHAYSKVGNGGEARGMSVARRRELALQRRTIADYRRSKLGALQDRPIMPKLTLDKSHDPAPDSSHDSAMTGNRQKGGIKESQQDSKSVERRHHFIEPPRRNFDKYS